MMSALEGSRVSPGGAFSLCVSAPSSQLGWEIRQIRVLLTGPQLEPACALRAPSLYPQKGINSTEKNEGKTTSEQPAWLQPVSTWKGETKECEITGGILYFSLDLWKWSLPSTDMYHTPVQHRLSAKVYLACLTEHSFSHGVHCWSCENRGMLGYIIQYLQ